MKPSTSTASSVKDDQLASAPAISPAEALALSRFVHDLQERARQVAALLSERKLPTLTILAHRASNDLLALEREFLSLASVFASADRNEAVSPSINSLAILTQINSDRQTP